MNIFCRTIKRLIILLSASLAMCAVASVSMAAELVTLSGATLVKHAANDGDSFFIEAHGKQLHVRLYFVDCTETQTKGRGQLQRLEEQRNHFGVPSLRTVIEFGHKATSFTQQQLARPFTVYTSYAKGGGRSGKRVYAFVKTAGSEYLSEKLVRNGLARVYGQRRVNPEGVASAVTFKKLYDLRDAALLDRAGIWSHSDADVLIIKRAQQRAKEQELDDLEEEALGLTSSSPSGDPSGLINVNSATSLELQTIRGIGPATAKKIISARPYSSVDELVKVSGIGPKTLKNIAPYLTVGDTH